MHRFHGEKGVGVITPDGGLDVFAHYSTISRTDYRELAKSERTESA
ncbi:cold shock domain-containing protein [Streptomyces sp. NPDC047972]